MTSKKLNVTATLASISVLLCWSTGPIFIKLLSGYVDVWMQNLLRYSISCLFWLPFLVLAVKRKKVNANIWRKAVGPSCVNVIMQSCWAGAFYFIEPAFGDLLNKTTVLWVVIFSLVFFPEERALLRSKRFWTGAILSIAGIAGVTTFKAGLQSKTIITGIALSMSCSVAWGVYTVSAKKSFKDTDSRYGFAVMSIYTVAGLLLLALLFGDIKICTTLTLRPWLYIVVSSLFGIAFGHVLYYVAIKRIGAMIPNLMLLATPFIVLSLSTHIFHEKMSVLQIFSGLRTAIPNLVQGCESSHFGITTRLLDGGRHFCFWD
jgi:drug/metabolite transporter (DMT)-like permease